MNKTKMMILALLMACVLFILAIIFFDDMSFVCLGTGIIIIGIVILVKLNQKKDV